MGRNLKNRSVAWWLVLTLPVCLSVWAQYPGRIQTGKKAAPSIRAIGVLEWTGDAGKPKASRIIPISVFDGEGYQPGGLYLARPAPLAVEPGTEYVLQDAGVSRGLFDVNSAQDVNGYWFGYGAWKPMLAPVKRVRAKQGTRIPQVIDGQDGRPHMKVRHPDDSPDATSSGSSSTSASPSSSSSDSTRDPDRPTLRKRSDASSTASTSSDDSKTPDGRAPETAIVGADPDRPHIAHGQQTPINPDSGPAQLTGIPSELQQMISVSDVSDRQTHPFTYLWNDAADATNMQTLMEAAASKAIAAAKLAAKTAIKPHTAATPAQRRRVPAKTPAAPSMVFTNVRFKAYELTYSGGATLVYSAETTNATGKTQYVTLIAQPDFNGVPKILFTSVTDQDHLDQKPRMRLVDAVDARNDNRGDLVFELRSQHDREFVIYRISGGVAEQVFTTGPLSSAQNS